jgi:hypothetical protein
MWTASQKVHMQGVRGLRNEAYFYVRRNDESQSATLRMDLVRSRLTEHGNEHPGR